MNRLDDLYRSRPQLLQTFVTALFALLILSLPRYTETAKIWYFLLILCALAFTLIRPGELKSTSRTERIFFCALLGNFAWIAFCYYANGEPGRGASFLWGRHFYLLFIIPLYLLFRSSPVADRILLPVLLGSVSISLIDILVDLAQGVDHRLQGMNPNAFGPIQLCLSGMLLLYALHSDERWSKYLAAIGAALGFATVILSLSKNTWLTFFALSFLAFCYLTRRLALWKQVGVVALLVAMLCSSYLLPLVKIRIDYGLASVADYFASDDYRDDSRLGSFGTRMELWKAGWKMFLENPVLGVGVGGFQVNARENSERYRVNDVVHRFKYVHNQYLAALATRGVPGLMFLLSILILPVYVAMSFKSQDRAARLSKWSILLICLVYLFGCVFEDHFEGKSATMFFGTMIPLMLARISRAESQRAGPDA